MECKILFSHKKCQCVFPLPISKTRSIINVNKISHNLHEENL
jgi:hypothetical protein